MLWVQSRNGRSFNVHCLLPVCTLRNTKKKLSNFQTTKHDMHKLMSSSSSIEFMKMKFDKMLYNKIFEYQGRLKYIGGSKDTN